jgi:uncharacterized protein
METAGPPGRPAMKRGAGRSDQEGLERQLIDCGDLNMRIARDGTWFYHGSPIGRKPLVKLFASVLRREEDGDYWLVTPAERGRIEVEDAPFTAVELAVAGLGRDQVLSFRTNLDDWVRAGPEHPIRVEPAAGRRGPRPYVRVRGLLDALILRPIYYELVALAVDREGEAGAELGVWSMGAFFPLGRSEAGG